MPMRHNGCVKPKGQRRGDARTGVLVVEERLDPELRRTVRVARLLEPRYRQTELMPALFDVVLVSVRDGTWSLTGFERKTVAVGGRSMSYQQSWLMKPVMDRDFSLDDAAREAELKRVADTIAKLPT